MHNASLPHVPVPSRAAYFSFRECLFVISSGYRVTTAHQGPDPLGKPRPDLGALRAGGSDARHRWSLKST